MNDVAKKTKKELVEKICTRLNEHGLRDTDSRGDDCEFSATKGTCAGFMYLPTDNLQQILNCNVDDWSDFGKVYNTWGRAGALRFKPYSDHCEDNPSLVIRHNRYLHMFRGYHFQASYTVNGIGDAGSGSYRTDFLVRAEYWQYLINNGLISYMLWWSAFIDVGFQFRNFAELFEEDIHVLEDFLSESMKFWNHKFEYKWSDVAECIEFSHSDIDVNVRKMYQISDDDRVGAYLAIGNKSIQVQTKKGTWALTLPDLMTGTGYISTSEEDMEGFEEEVSILERNHYLEMLAVMLLKLAGIHISFINWYPLDGKKSFDYMRPINSPDVIKAKSLNEIYNAEPDEF